MGLDVGVFLPTAAAPGGRPGDVQAAARQAEELGLESVWAVDQLVAGTGSPLLDSTVALSAAAAVTHRVKLGFGVLIAPLHPAVWVAKQVATLQHVSGDRVILGVGVGGDRHELSWAATGVPRRERGRRTDAALRALPGLIAGEPTAVPDVPGTPVVRLAPGATVPPIVVGGTSDAALARTATHGDGWFIMPGPPEATDAEHARLAAAAAAAGRPTPPITLNMMFVLEGDPAVPDPATVERTVADPDGSYGIPAEYQAAMIFRGPVEEVAKRLAAYAHHNAERIVVTLPAGDWHRQAELLAAAAAQAG